MTLLVPRNAFNHMEPVSALAPQFLEQVVELTLVMPRSGILQDCRADPAYITKTIAVVFLILIS